MKEDVPVLKKAGVTYDKRTYTATVTLTDNGDGTISTKIVWTLNGAEAKKALFENSYTPPKVPKTGDEQNLIGPIMLMVLGMIGIGTTLFFWHKTSRGKAKRSKKGSAGNS